jgi:hypothetical protein
MTGFGQVHPFPGLWPSFHLNTAITLPVGVEAYAAYALRAWLTTSSLSPVTSRCGHVEFEGRIRQTLVPMPAGLGLTFRVLGW